VLSSYTISEVFVPTYSYACTDCGDRFDAVQAFSDDALTTCDKCNGRLRKLFGNVGVVFKGSGFYRNDSRESAKASSSASNGSSNGSSDSSASSTSDKPAKAEKSGSSDSSSSSTTAAPAAAASS
jgi:putative FmdB family regulatory protein